MERPHVCVLWLLDHCEPVSLSEETADLVSVPEELGGPQISWALSSGCSFCCPLGAVLWRALQTIVEL